MTRARMMQEMDSPEYTMWLAKYDIEPFGPKCEWERAGVIASAILNSQRASSDAKVWEPADFFPFLTRDLTEEDEQAERERIALKVQQALGLAIAFQEMPHG